MVSAFSSNIQLEEPARGDDVGTWDTPVNNNMTLIDLILGGNVSIPVNNAPIVLSAAQYKCKTITFTSTLAANITITFPTSFVKSYEIQHQCTGSSAFTITLQTTAGGGTGAVIGVPPWQITTIMNDGQSIKFTNLPPVGTYLDYAGGGVPAWVSVCTTPPYLDCNGAVYSAATYPQLFNVLNTTTLPDFRGRTAFYLNEGTGRLTAAGAGINGDINFQTGGNNGVTLSASMIPTLNCQGSNNITVQSQNGFTGIPLAPSAGNIAGSGVASPGGVYVPGNTAASWASANSLSAFNTISVNTQGTGGGIVQATVPGIVAGLRLIRAG